MRTLIWFRSDLRTDDNAALYHAAEAAERGVVAVFVICAEQWRAHEWGAPKVDFVLRNLRALSEQLRRLNIPLLIRQTGGFERVPEALLEVARRHECDALYFNREYEVNESRRDEEVTQAFEAEALAVQTFDDQVVVAPDVLRTGGGGFYKVFTPFKRAWIAHLEEHGYELPLSSPRKQPQLPCPSDVVPETIDGFSPSRSYAELWPAGETHAAERLARFVEQRIAAYEDDRDFPGIDGSSRLSPYLSAGVISPRRCLDAAIAANSGRIDSGRAGPSTWINELIWREFYRSLMVGFPRVSMGRAFKPETEAVPWRSDKSDFDAWREGRTGVPIVDAGMRQLAETGWMHNRLRMIVAMFLTKDLLIDWRWGERHFMQNLVDADLANNNGGWQWAASTGADAAPYFRMFNPFMQGRKFDPDGEFIRRYVPELQDVDARVLHDPKKLSIATQSRLDYPEPICDHGAARKRAMDAFKRGRVRIPVNL